MVSIGNILAATNFSANAALAEARCALLCADLGLPRFHLLHVQGSGPDRFFSLSPKGPLAAVQPALSASTLIKLETARQHLQARHGIACAIEARTGDVVSEILACAEDHAADVIAVGNSSRNCVEQLLGTTASSLVRRANRPVLLVRTAPLQGYRNVLAPINFSGASRQAARLALAIAPQAGVTFLHAYSVWAEGKMKLADVDEDVINAYRWRHGVDARELLDSFIEELDCDARLVSRAVRPGLAVPVITSHAEKTAPDLIVLGSHGGSRAEEYLMGNIVRRVINDTQCDVLVTPAAEPGGDFTDQRPAA